MDTIKSTLSENFGGVAHKLTKNPFSLEDCPDLTGKVAVGTGLSEGIGYGFAFTLLKNNLKELHAISVSKEVQEGATKDIEEKLGAETAARVKWYQCNLDDWSKVARVGSEIAKATPRIDILFNDAARGIMTYQLTDYGVDRHMAVNHVAHVILTTTLLPVLKKTAADGNKVRINNQSSNVHQSTPSDTKFASLEELNQDLGPNTQYGRAKLANLLYARYLGRHLSSKYPNILCNATHPGIVESTMSSKDILEPYPIAGHAMSTLLKPFKKDQWEGACSAVYACTVTNGTGEYICPPAVVEEGSKMSRDEALQDQLMALTSQLIKDKLPKELVESGDLLKFY